MTDRRVGSATGRWTDRLHAPEHDARVAAERTGDVMARILEELRMLDTEDLGLPRASAPAPKLAAARVG